MMLQDEIAEIADKTGFSGTVLARANSISFELERGLASRADKIPITLETRFASASATKGLTALVVASLIESGELELTSKLNSLIGAALPRVHPDVTIEHLLGHTSGVGDYLDEELLEDVDDHVLGASAHTLEHPQDYRTLLAELTQKTAPGEQFAYNNSGYVMLSLAAEAVTGASFYDLVEERVCQPAGMLDTSFLRSDDLPPGAATGYLANGRTNVFHLPVRGAGDGGVYSTVGDFNAFWTALFDGRIVSQSMADALTTSRSNSRPGEMSYGLGFWLAPNGSTVILEGMDAGVSFRSAYDPTCAWGYTVMSNTSSGVWPIADHLDSSLM